MDFHPTLETFATRIKELSREEFLELQQVPLLFISLDGLPPNVSRELAFANTVALESPPVPSPSDDGPLDPSRTVVALVSKSERNEHPVVTLGRAPLNDIVVPARSVSKFHAFFVEDEKGNMTLTDAKSSFGTRINKKSIEPEVGHVLASGDSITLAKLANATYLTPEGCYDYMQVIFRLADRRRGR
ncbi:MAG: FHA domain-containing protein [Planctomycetota bacterium]